jgi:Nucleoside-diphosphate-sugar epimerases
MKALVVGAAGFIGSHLTDELLKRRWNVTAIDVLSEKEAKNLEHIPRNSDFIYRTIDATDQEAVKEVVKGCDMVFHMAANADVLAGSKDPAMDISSTLMTTVSILEAMRKTGVKNIFFASSSAIYGDTRQEVLKEDRRGEPISYYGAAKLASEELIGSYAYMDSFNALIFRFPNVVGTRLTHGVIVDLMGKLKKNPKELEILGNGKQRKQYVHVSDLVNGIADFSEDVEPGMNIYNISTDSFTSVNEIADMICARLGLKDVKYKYAGGNVGWKGDVPMFAYDISKAKAKGWKFSHSSNESVKKTLDDIKI